MGALVRHVALFDEKGILQQFAPGEEPPAWARKKLTNPALWDDAPDVVVDGDQGSEGSPSGDGDEPPPLAGPGSGRDPWAAYAAKFADKVEVSEDDKRDEIVAKLREAGVRVE